jgi:hypothetical protein
LNKSQTISSTIDRELNKLAKYLFIPEDSILENNLYKELLVYNIFKRLPDLILTRHVPNHEKLSEVNKYIRTKLKRRDTIYSLAHECLEKHEARRKLLELGDPIKPQSGSTQIFLTPRQVLLLYQTAKEL